MIVIVELDGTLHGIGSAALIPPDAVDRMIFFDADQSRIWDRVLANCLGGTKFEVAKGVPRVEPGTEVIAFTSDKTRAELKAGGAKLVSAPPRRALEMPESRIKISKYDMHVGYFDTEDAAVEFMKHLSSSGMRLVLFVDVVPRGIYTQVEYDPLVGDIFKTEHPGVYMCRYFPTSFDQMLELVASSSSPVGVSGDSSAYIATAAGHEIFTREEQKEEKVGGDLSSEIYAATAAISYTSIIIAFIIVLLVCWIYWLYYEPSSRSRFDIRNA